MWALVLPLLLLPALQPLPDTAALFAATRANLSRAGRVQNQFAYKERRTQLHLNPFGRLGTGGTIVYEMTPTADGYSRRVLEEDGKPVAGAEPEIVRRRRGRDDAPSPSPLSDVIASIILTVDRRDALDGRPAIVVKFQPNPGASPKTREGRLARSFRGEIWIDETAQEVARIDAVAVDSISYGFGLVARLGAGTKVTVRREPQGDVWLPVSVRFTGEGRALLLRKLNIDMAIDWYDYQRASGAGRPQ